MEKEIQLSHKAEQLKPEREKISFQNLYKQLSKPIPKQFYVKYKEDGKEFTGYHAQYAIDLLNEIIGLGKWHTICEVRKEESIGKGWATAGMVTILIQWEEKDFAVNGFGGSYAKDIANAYKGFKTSAFKNACRYLGIGRELYAKGFEDDIVVEKEIQVEVPELSNDLANKIDTCQSVTELEKLQDVIQSAEGESVKKVLIKKYNNRKIFLIDSSKQ